MEQQDAAASGAGVTMEVTHHDPTGAGHGVKADDDDLTLGAEGQGHLLQSCLLHSIS